MSELPYLLEHAIKQETERQVFPLWLASYAVNKIKGVETMEYDVFIQSIFDNKDNKTITEKRTKEDIMKEFAPLIDAERARARR